MDDRARQIVAVVVIGTLGWLGAATRAHGADPPRRTADPPPDAEMLLDLDLLKDADFTKQRDLLRRLKLLERLQFLETLRSLEGQVEGASGKSGGAR